MKREQIDLSLFTDLLFTRSAEHDRIITKCNYISGTSINYLYLELPDAVFTQRL